jgi:hypothetical protein
LPTAFGIEPSTAIWTAVEGPFWLVRPKAGPEIVNGASLLPRVSLDDVEKFGVRANEAFGALLRYGLH